VAWRFCIIIPQIRLVAGSHSKENKELVLLEDAIAPTMDTNIVILTGNHLCNNPRVIKEGVTLSNAGYTVTVIGAWLDQGLKAQDLEMQKVLPFCFKPAIDTTDDVLLRLRLRASVKLSTITHRFARVESRSQLGYAYRGLRAASRQPANLYIAHSELGMDAAANLLREGWPVGIDMEDWYSEDLLPEARKSRPLGLLRNLEKELLTTCSHATCPSRAMSEALATEFGCPQPTAVYNAFPWSDREFIDGLFKDRRKRCVPSIHWFSQTIGHGRGLDDLIAALPLLKQEAEIHLRGKPVNGFENWLAHRVPEAWQGQIKIHPLVSNSELLSRIAEHDIGFAGETPLMRSRDLTVTNKILHYLLGGLAVVASDTAGQREVAEQAPGAVFLYRSGDAPALAARLNALLESAGALQQAKAAALFAAERTFCWERQEPALLGSIRHALGSTAG
jgi:glycosyltransferase involved in cell wall biosynthesis